jgi:hypothetical protein
MYLDDIWWDCSQLYAPSCSFWESYTPKPASCKNLQTSHATCEETQSYFSSEFVLRVLEVEVENLHLSLKDNNNGDKLTTVDRKILAIVLIWQIWWVGKNHQIKQRHHFPFTVKHNYDFSKFCYFKQQIC